MSKADIIFRDMCNDIITNGTSTETHDNRTVWADTGEAAYTIKQFGVCNRYDLREEFPAITFRRTAIKSATDEILWIYQKKCNNVNELSSKIWDQWADTYGSIGKSYGFQAGKKYIHHKSYLNLSERNEMADTYPSFEYNCSDTNVWLDQTDAILYDLKHRPYSRRIMTNLYNLDDLHSMNLYPCAYSCSFNVTDEGYDKPILNMILNQRSQDILVANNWNVSQYSVFLMMLAQVCDMIAGRLVHVILDAHIYNRHTDLVKELIGRKMYDAPIVTLDPDIKNFYDFTKDSVKISNYETGPQITNIPVAI